MGPEGLRVLLDWELSHLGDPVEDLAWCCVRSWRFGNDDLPVGGFGTVDALLAAYAAAGGATVDPAHHGWWEAFGTLKWGLISAMQAHTHLGGLVRSVELATLGRRIAETEWDLLVLLVPEAVETAALLPEPVADATPRSLQDRPSAAELLEAVREFVEQDVQPVLEGRRGSTPVSPRTRWASSSASWCWGRPSTRPSSRGSRSCSAGTARRGSS